MNTRLDYHLPDDETDRVAVVTGCPTLASSLSHARRLHPDWRIAAIAEILDFEAAALGAASEIEVIPVEPWRAEYYRLMAEAMRTVDAQRQILEGQALALLASNTAAAA